MIEDARNDAYAIALDKAPEHPALIREPRHSRKLVRVWQAIGVLRPDKHPNGEVEKRLPARGSSGRSPPG